MECHIEPSNQLGSLKIYTLCLCAGKNGRGFYNRDGKTTATVGKQGRE
ncbi:hypothetical protein A1Q_3674 [Vibrio campbellii HY01]|nr:hypothetical protein A1Q_3674 [Vibrio campbellii HY01]